MPYIIYTLNIKAHFFRRFTAQAVCSVPLSWDLLTPSPSLHRFRLSEAWHRFRNALSSNQAQRDNQDYRAWTWGEKALPSPQQVSNQRMIPQRH